MKKIKIKSVKHKLDLIIGSLILLFALFLYFYFPNKLKNEQIKSLKKNAMSIAQISSIMASPGLYFDDYEGISEGIEPILQDKNISYIIIENKNDSIYYVYNYEYAKELKYKGNSDEEVILKENDICLNVDIVLQNNSLGRLYLGYSLKNLYAELEQAQFTITIITIIILLVGLILARLLSNFVTKPLSKIVTTADKIASGDLALRSEVISDDEIGYLAKSFNNMLDMIQKSQVQLEKTNEELSEEISIRKITEQNLKISENRFRLIFQKSNDFIYLSELLNNGTDRLIEVNNLLCETLHYTPRELYGKSYRVLLSPKAEKNDNMLDLLLKHGTEISESIYMSKDGNDINVEVNANLFDLHGRKVILSIARNITDRKNAEAALKESEERFRSIYNNATIGIYRTSESGDILMANQAIMDMLGYSSFTQMANSDYIKNVYENAESRAEFREIIKEKGIVSGYETTWIKADGSRIFVRESARGVWDENGNIEYYEGVVEDITNWKETELELIRSKEKAEESDRLKSEFLAQMSHEIRTPINTIMNFTSLLQMETEDKISEELAGGFNSIKNAATRLLRTINLVLNMSDIESGTYEASHENSNIIKDVLKPVQMEFLGAANSKGLDLNLVNECSDDMVYVDHYTISQIMANLVDNAIKYTDKGKIDIVVEDNHKDLQVTIRDTGIGISKEYLPKLFNKFSQEEQGYTRRYEGNGLGLALVKKYCDINSTSISVESEKGVGTSFILQIPREG